MFFIKQYEKYHDYWYASSYLASLINNEQILSYLTTESLISCITDYKESVNSETDKYKKNILKEIKKRDKKKYEEVLNLDYFKTVGYLKQIIDHTILGKKELIPENLYWEDDYFLVINNLFIQGKLKHSPKVWLDKHRSEWSKNDEYIKIYHANFHDK